MNKTCPYSCYRYITGTSNCSTCPASSNRTLSNNACPCNAGFYDNGVAACASIHYRLILGCTVTCATCNSSNTCLTCPANSNRIVNSTGICVCNSGYFDSGV
jgi:hypothetical protein